jgi:hypothetical protein
MMLLFGGSGTRYLPSHHQQRTGSRYSNRKCWLQDMRRYSKILLYEKFEVITLSVYLRPAFGENNSLSPDYFDIGIFILHRDMNYAASHKTGARFCLLTAF